MKRIVIVNQDSGYLMIDIANAFVEEGYMVSLISGRLVERNTPLSKSVKLDKIIKYRRSNIPVRLITWLVAIIQIIFKIWFKYSSCYLFIVSNPPLAPLIPLHCSNPFSLLIYDIYVDKPEELQFLRPKSLPVRLWKKAHSRVFSCAKNIFTLSKGMASTLEKYSGGKKCEVVPIWTDNVFLKPISVKQNPFITEHQLQNKFIVLYSGSIGVSSGVEYLIEAASIVKSEQILFVIIGEGLKKQSIQNRIIELALGNCLVLPWQETKVLPYSLASANLAVVSLLSNSSNSAIPSKLYNYLSVGVPILCLAEPESDLGSFVTSQDIGKCFLPNKKEEIAEYIGQVASNPAEAKRIGDNSLIISKQFTRENANRFISSIKSDTSSEKI